MSKTRRLALCLLASGLGYTFTPPVFAKSLLTPRQMRGPFYPDKIPRNSDNDLTQVAGHNRTAFGDTAYLLGRVLNPLGQTVANAQIEIWQCDNFGYYNHPRDGGGHDRAFQGYGRTHSGSNGEYRFKTIRPVPYSGRAPHIHMCIRTKTAELTTQIYVKGEQLNNNDLILNSILDKKSRSSLIIPFLKKPGYSPNDLVAEFNPVIAT